MVINNKNHGKKLKVSKFDYFKSNIVVFVTNDHKQTKKNLQKVKIVFPFKVSRLKQVKIVFKTKKLTSKT